METATIGTLTALLKAAASPVLKAALGKPTLRLRVAWIVYRRGKKASMGVTFVGLLTWLSRTDVREQLVAADPFSVETAVASLAWRIRGQSLEQATLLVKWALDEYLLSGSPQAATVITSSRTQHQVTDANQRIESALSQLSREMHEQPAQFDRDLSLLHPWVTPTARELGQRWPPIRDLTHSLTSASDRGRLLSDWATTPPVQMDEAPAEGWLWFGELATEYGAKRAAVDLITKGIAHGAAEPGYWWARAALAIGAEPDEVEMRSLLAKGPLHPLGAAVLSLLNGDPGGTEAVIGPWEPLTPQDCALRAHYLSAAAAAKGMENLAIVAAG